MFNVNEIRKDFPILKTKTNSGNDLIYFDNSATTLKPKVVIDAVSNYYEKMTANVHRGDYDLSHNVDTEYELTRKVVASFINAKKEEIVFTNGATSGINMVSFGLKEMIINENDEITTMMKRPLMKCWQTVGYLPEIWPRRMRMVSFSW